MAAGSVNTGQDPTGAEIDTDAFKQLYPLQFHERFFEAGLRPDGRTLGRARALTIGLDSVTSALGSCLAKLGATTVLAGVRAHVGEVSEGQSNEGTLKLSVELAPFATADTCGNVAQELLATLTQRLHSIILPLALHKQLGISEGKAAFHVQLDAYVLNADGAVFDALLLAVVAALQDTRLPLVQQDAEGKVTEVARGTAASQGLTGQRFKLSHLPVAVTCALVGGHLLVDPTHEEEAIQDSSVCVVLDGKGSLHGMYKSGGTVAAPPMTFLKCIEAAKLRYKEVEQQLVLMLQAAEASRAVASTAMQE